ncbi:MAG: hypothetical protein PQ275_33760 [Elizabethkingia anophelis]|nr:MAG: hypothetical protein PQ275_33760 [Elizabethkingia anophelis]
MIVKIVIECPEGKLLCPDNVFPIIVKLLLSKTAAGLGMANKDFKGLQKTAEMSEAVINAPHTFGA